jgi:hypothetical protein
MITSVSRLLCCSAGFGLLFFFAPQPDLAAAGGGAPLPRPLPRPRPRPRPRARACPRPLAAAAGCGSDGVGGAVSDSRRVHRDLGGAEGPSAGGGGSSSPASPCLVAMAAEHGAGVREARYPRCVWTGTLSALLRRRG